MANPAPAAANQIQDNQPGLGYRLGLPAWAFPGWTGTFWDARPSALHCYSQVFNCVEGNTTFYRVPDPQTIDQWARSVAGRDFKFSFKLPRELTHESSLDTPAIRDFLKVFEPLSQHLGPWLVQFPAWMGPREVPRIRQVLATVADFGPAVLEVRHPQFFDAPELLESLVKELPVSRLTLDTRALYRGDLNHPEVRSARHQKPALPVTPYADHGLMFVRLVLHPDPISHGPVLKDWLTWCGAALARGQQVHMLIHCPNNQHCPVFARQFHNQLAAIVPGLGALPGWPMPDQASLF